MVLELEDSAGSTCFLKVLDGSKKLVGECLRCFSLNEAHVQVLSIGKLILIEGVMLYRSSNAENI